MTLGNITIRSGSECDPIEFSLMNSLLKAMDVFTSLGSEHMPFYYRMW